MNTKSYSGRWSCFVEAFSWAHEKAPPLWFAWMKARTSDFIDFSKRLFFISTRWLARLKNRGTFRAHRERGFEVSAIAPLIRAARRENLPPAGRFWAHSDLCQLGPLFLSALIPLDVPLTVAALRPRQNREQRRSMWSCENIENSQ